jgi:hypothetical protein
MKSKTKHKAIGVKQACNIKNYRYVCNVSAASAAILASASASACSSSSGSLTKSSGPMTHPESASLDEEEEGGGVSERGRQCHGVPRVGRQLRWRRTAVVHPYAHAALLRRLGADDARLPLGRSLRHRAVDNVVATATSADAATTLTSAVALGSHLWELLG